MTPTDEALANHSPQRHDVDAAFCAYRLHTYASNLSTATVGGLLALALLTVLMAPVVPAPWLHLWQGAVVLALALRAAIGWWHLRSPPGATADAVWLWRYRAGVVLHGMVWAGASWLPLPANDMVSEVLRALVIVGLVGGSFALLASTFGGPCLLGRWRWVRNAFTCGSWVHPSKWHWPRPAG